MWIPGKVVTFFDRLVQATEDNAEAMQNTLQELREQNAILRTENSLIKSDLQSTKATNSWLIQKINGLEVEKSGLMEKAYNIKLPTPEIVRVNRQAEPTGQFSFEDMGDAAARVLGLSTYDNN